MRPPKEGGKYLDVLRGLGGFPMSSEALIWVTAGWGN